MSFLVNIRTLLFTFVFLGNVSVGLHANFDQTEISRVNTENTKDPLKAYLLPPDHPLHKRLDGLFRSPKMFDSGTAFKNAGFKVIRGHRDLMVGNHPKIKEYMIKKFPNFRSQTEQLNNFIKRIKAARILQKYVKDNNFTHIIIPNKWLYELPSNFSSSKHPKQYVLIVDKMDVVSGGDHGESRKRYFNMSKEVLTEYCTLLYDLDGCDAWPRNQPFTKAGQIAFLDTEHLGLKRGDFVTHILQFLNKDLKKFGMDLWKKLESRDEDRSITSPPVELKTTEEENFDSDDFSDGELFSAYSSSHVFMKRNVVITLGYKFLAVV